MVLNIVDIVENSIVNAMNNKIQIVSFEGVVIVVKNPLWTRKNTILTDDLNNEYKVIDVDYTLNQITLDTDYIGSNKVVTIPIPFYYHGTPMVTNAEWRSQNVPFIWLVEPVKERGQNSNSSIDRESELVILFVDNRDNVNWTNNDIHEQRSQSLLNMADEFEKAIDNNPYMFKRGVSDFDKTNLAKLGRESREGFVSHILDADLTAVDLRGSLFIYRSGCNASSSLPSCLPAIAQNTNNTFQMTIPSGMTDTIPDTPVTVKNQTGATIGNGIVTSVTGGEVEVNITPCEDANYQLTLNNVEVSNGSISSGATQAIPIDSFIPSCDPVTIDIQNSDGSFSVQDSEPAGGTFQEILPDQSIEVNDVVVGNIPSVGTINVNLSDGTNPVTPIDVSIVGRDINIEVPTSEPPIIIVDPDAQIYIDAVELADGMALEDYIKGQIDTMYLAFKSTGVWTSLGNFAVTAFARTLAGALVPIKGVIPQNVANAFLAGDYNRINGLISNALAKRLLLNNFSSFSPSASNNHHLAVYVQEPATESGWFMNDFSAGTGTVGIGLSGTNTLTIRGQSTTSTNIVTQPSTPFFFGMTRSLSTGFRWLINQATETSVTQASQTLNTANMGVFCDGLGVNQLNARQIFYSMGFNVNLVTLRGIMNTFIINCQNFLNIPVVPVNEYDVIFIAGQSNPDGRAEFSDVNTPGYIGNGILKKATGENIKVWNGTGIVDYNFSNVGSTGNGSQFLFGVPTPIQRWGMTHVAIQQIANFSAKPILIVQVTEGGTQLTHLPYAGTNKGSWNTNFASIFAGGVPLALRIKQRYDTLKTFASANGLTLNPKAVLWHQGEADKAVSLNMGLTLAERNSALTDYQTNLQDLIAYFRSVPFTNNANLLWLSGTVSASSSSFDAAIQTGMQNVDSADNRAFYMNTDNLAFIDGLHFNGWSNVVFGNWLAQRYLENVL